jgi:hypothetical protein
VLEEILPVHGEEWEDVLLSHAANFPGSHRTSDSLHRKFLQLYRVKKPTGDPFCPPDVRKAKCLCHLITTKCEIDDAEGGPLAPDVSFDHDIIEDDNVENEDDEGGAQHGVVRENHAAEVPQVAHGNGVLAPLPPNISDIAASRKRAAVRNKSDDILEVYKLKILQKEEEREAERERYEREREERAAEMRMRREEEERRFRHEVELRKAEAEARREEMKAEAESRREEARAFRVMLMIMMMGKKHDKNINY